MNGIKRNKRWASSYDILLPGVNPILEKKLL